jgi:ATP-dependent Zn protease
MKKTDEEGKDVTYQNMLTDIKVSLAGAIAEEIVYGSENRSVGASSDLVNATVAASKCIRTFGFGRHLAALTYLKDPMTTKEGLLVNPDDQEDINEEIMELLRMCKKEVKQLLLTDEWHKMLIESSKYLAKHAAMTQKKMKQIYSKVPDHLKCDKEERFYRDILAKL